MQNDLVALPKYLDEEARLKTLAAYDAIGTPVDSSFNRLVRLAARVLDAPVALISLVGRDMQFFIARVGIELCETRREVSFCVHALGGHDALIVLDATQDPRFCSNPLVAGEPHIRFYAGAPLVGFSGDVIGTLCVIDFKARPEFSNAQTETLKDIAALVMQQMELHRLRRVEEAAQRTQDALRTSEQQFRLLVGSVTDYALYMLSPTGMITSWNEGAQRIKGYTAEEVIGEHFSIFCTNEQRMQGVPARSLSIAVEQGRFEADAWRVRKDGSLFWANIVVVPIYGEAGELVGFAKITRDNSERHNNEERLYRLAHFDSLTQLPNRFSMNTKLEEFLEAHPAVTVLMLDLDEFKDVNDTLGHAAGDFLLKEAGSRIQACIGDRGIVGRLGGDEFAVALPGLADPLSVSETCRQLIASFRAPFRWEAEEVYVVPCIGIAMSPSHGTTSGDLFANADLALYHAKSTTQRGFSLFQPTMRQSALARRTCESELRDAVAQGELEMFFQPQVRLADRCIVGAEALLRWRHPKRGLLAPAAFLGVLDRSALAPTVGDWTIRVACGQAAAVRRLGLANFRVAVNLFGSQFRAGRLVSTVTRALDENGLPPDALELEITENIIRQHDEAVMRPLRELRSLGVHTAFDDFGTGYASLSLLKRVPLTRLKIDQSFIRDLCFDPEDAAVVKAVIYLAKSFELDAIAEGIETEEQVAALQELGCELGQGYLYGRPMEAQQMLDLIAGEARNEGGEEAAEVRAAASRKRSYRIICPIFSATFCGNRNVSRTISSISSPVAPSTIKFRFSDAARKSGSLSMARNAARKAASRSGGTPGVVRMERPISPVLAAARRTSRPSSDCASSGSVGTFGSRRCRLSAA